MLNADLIGRRYPPAPPYEVSREKIREFADMLGDPDPAFRDPEAARALGYPDVIAPPTFAFTVAMESIRRVTADPDFGFVGTYVMQSAQTFRSSRPLRAGDRVVVGVVIEEITSVRGTAVVGIRVELVTEDGESVVDMTVQMVAPKGGTRVL